MSIRNCVKCFQFTLLLFLVGCGNSLAKSEHTAHQTSIQTDRFAVGQKLPQPVTTTLNYETLVDKTAGKVSGKAYRKYQDRFEDYLQARRTGLRGKLFEAAVAYEANQHLGFDNDLRDYRVAALILKVLGIESIRLATNNPRKLSGLRDNGICITERTPVVMELNVHNTDYLVAKAHKSGHLLPL